MKPNEYQRAALTTEADQMEILLRYKQMSHTDLITAVELSNGVRGLSDEVGELNGALKKWLEYGKALDVTNILEECGDCLWRVCQILNAVDLTMEQAMEANLRKLSGSKDARYNEGFSNDKALNRDTEAERRRLTAEDDGPCYGEF